jgi:PKD repeat protein
MIAGDQDAPLAVVKDRVARGGGRFLIQIFDCSLTRKEDVRPSVVSPMRIGHVRLLLTAWLAMVGAVVFPLGVGAASAEPTADFDWAPKPVVAGATVTFTSTSTPFNLDTPIVDTRWDFNGDHKFDASSTDGIATATAPSPGTWTVTLRVEDITGEGDTVTKGISVEAPPPPPLEPPPPPPPESPPPPPNQPPTAAFAALPGSPLVGEEVTFVSYSDDHDGHISEQAWDLNADGNFDDATGPLVTHRFSAPGGRTVTLRVTDDKGADSTLSLTVFVREQPPSSLQPLIGPAPLPSMLSPFPIVRLVGSVTEAGTKIRLLSVRAPKGARALVRCRGRGCPVKRAKKVVGRHPVRFGALKHLMPAGVVLEVLVHRDDTIGKFTRFRLRQNRRPRRADGCLWPGTNRMAPCPEA